MIEKFVTLRDFAASERVAVDTIQRRYKAAFGRWAARDSVLTETEVSVLRNGTERKRGTERNGSGRTEERNGKRNGKRNGTERKAERNGTERKDGRTERNGTEIKTNSALSGTEDSVFLNVRPAAAKVSPPAEFTRGNFRAAILIALMAIPAVASVQNMHTVTLDICGHEFAALLLTGLFSASPFLFVLAGMKNRLTVALVALLIAYEAFANFTRIYGGLTGFGKNGYPTRFLGLVTDICNSGTHQTALFLAGIMSLLAASVFYAAYNELRK